MIRRHYARHYGRVRTTPRQQARDAIALALASAIVVVASLLLRDLPVNAIAIGFAVAMGVGYALGTGLRAHHLAISARCSSPGPSRSGTASTPRTPGSSSPVPRSRSPASSTTAPSCTPSGRPPMPEPDLELDRLIHEPGRLAILTVLSSASDADFLFVQRATGLTKGNLSSHMTKLEDAGLVTIEKRFVGRRPNTRLALTDEGRRRIARHWEQLDRLRETARRTSRAPRAAPQASR